jgi:hypothetical protein
VFKNNPYYNNTNPSSVDYKNLYNNLHIYRKKAGLANDFGDMWVYRVDIKNRRSSHEVMNKVSLFYESQIFNFLVNLTIFIDKASTFVY